MTIIAIVLFMVPFMSLCIFILVWGTYDLRNQKRESQQHQKLNQNRNQINSTDSLIHSPRRREHKRSAERQAKALQKLCETYAELCAFAVKRFQQFYFPARQSELL